MSFRVLLIGDEGVLIGFQPVGRRRLDLDLKFLGFEAGTDILMVVRTRKVFVSRHLFLLMGIS